MVGGGVAGIDGDGLVKISDGRRGLVLFEAGEAALVVCLRPLVATGKERDRLAQAGDGLGRLALLHLRQPPLVVGAGMAGVKGDGLVIVGDSRTQITQRRPGDAPVQIGVDLFRVEYDGLVIVGDGRTEIIPLKMDPSHGRSG